MLRIGVLGPLTISVDGTLADVRSTTQRRALIYLALHRGQVVSSDRLAEAVWPGGAPSHSRHAVHSLIHRLRHHLAAHSQVAGSPLQRQDPGYMLVLSNHDVDAGSFAELVAAGRSAAAHRPDAAVDQLRAALGLWRGDPLMDVAYEPWAAAEIRRLEEMRIGACESLARLRLDLGHGERTIADLQSLTELYPLRESLWLLLWEALARAGRHVEVTADYRRAADLLASEYGLLPSEHLHDAGLRYADPVAEDRS